MRLTGVTINKEGKVEVNLLCSKSHMAPLKSMTIEDQRGGPVLNEQDPEVKKATAIKATSHATEVKRDHTEYFLTYYSSWKKLKVMTAQMLQFKKYLKGQ